jgi:hypothetical protein
MLPRVVWPWRLATAATGEGGDGFRSGWHVSEVQVDVLIDAVMCARRSADGQAGYLILFIRIGVFGVTAVAGNRPASRGARIL